MTVSRSMTQMPSPVRSSIMTLLSLVSLWVTRSGMRPAASPSTTTPVSFSRARTKSISGRTPEARPAGSCSSASRKASKRFRVWWKLGMVSWSRSPGRRASIFWKLPKAFEAA